MSTIQQGILGAGKGKVGGVIMSSWKGISTIRSMPASVANPQTVAQTAQRTKFSAVVAVARLLLSELIAIYWDPFAKKMSGYNDFVKRNIACFTGGVFATPADFVAARGTLVGVSNLAISASISNHSIVATYDNNSGVGDALASDVGRICFYNADQNYWKTITSTGKREDEMAEFVDNDFNDGDTLQCYFFFSRPDVSKISDSAYKEVIATA